MAIRFRSSHTFGTVAVYLLVLLVLLVTGPATADKPGQWPWDKKEAVDPPVYAEILVTAEWIQKHLGDPTVEVVDARPREAYDQAHLTGALSLPASSLPYDEDDLPRALGRSGLSPDRTIVCYGERGVDTRSARLFWLLELAGGTRIRYLDGGLAAWKAAGYGLTSEEPLRAPAIWNAVRDSSRIIDRAGVKARFGTDGWEVLDARTTGLGNDYAAFKRADSVWRRGHIPHALPVDFPAFLHEDGTFPVPEELRAELARLGPRPNTYVDMQASFLLYDHDQTGAGLRGYLMLRVAGVPRVRYYPGGWTDWSAAGDLPVTRIVNLKEVRAHLDAEPVAWAEDRPPRSVVLLDTRHWTGYFKGHIPGAVSAPAQEFPDSVETLLGRHWQDVDRQNTPALVYCYGQTCIRSRNCTTLLARHGFLNLLWYRAGMTEWQRHKLQEFADPEQIELKKKQY